MIHQVAGRDYRTCSGAPYERQARGGPITIDDAHEGGDELVAVLVDRVLRLQEEISRLARDTADTEEQVALACRRLAEQNPQRSTVYLATAHEADRFAAHKRKEQRRWPLA